MYPLTMLFDLPLDTLESFCPPLMEPSDFDSFWERTLHEAKRLAKAPVFLPVKTPLRSIEVFDVSFSGFGGQEIRGWLLVPKSEKKLPCVVEYIGYGGGRGLPHDWLLYPSAGYATFVMDVRGQGSSWRTGDTPDLEIEPSGPQYPGFLTRGILNKDTYYYRRLITDAVLAVEAVANHPLVDSQRLAIAGISQGGGLTLAVSGLSNLPRLALPDVPFLCHFSRAVSITDSFPYAEIKHFLKQHRDQEDHVWLTLSYFDGQSFSKRASQRALFSVALMDETCPPSTVYSAYNRWVGPKKIRVWPYNGHEGGEGFQALQRLEFLEKYL